MCTQNQELITALHNACQQLKSATSGKAAETKLQKALDKLHKIQQAAPPAETAGTTGSQPAAEPMNVAAAAEATVQKTDSTQLTAVVPTTQGIPSQGHPAVARPGHSQRPGNQSGHSGDVEIDPVEAEGTDMAMETMIPVQQEAAATAYTKASEGQSEQPGSSTQADKDKMLAERKVQKEEAKVQARVFCWCS